MNKEVYREHLAALQSAFPGANLISLLQASQYLGISREKLLAEKTFPAKTIGGRTHYITLISLAAWLAA